MSNNTIITPGLFALGAANNLFDPNHDPYWNKVATLMHFDGAQGNSVFTDVKGRGVTNSGVITDLGSPAIAPASAYFNGSSGMSIAQADDNQTGDFTVEFFAKWETITNCSLVDSRPLSNNGAFLDFFYYSGSFGIYMNSTTQAAAAYAVTLNKTYHVAVSRKSGVVRMFLDGVLLFTWNYAGVLSMPRFFLGGNGYNQSIEFFKGRMSEFRYTKGVGRYENPFVPVYARFPASL
jgi:hypothetical protein